MELWNLTQVKPATMLAFLIGSALFISAVLLFLLGVAAATAHEHALWLAVPVFVIGTLIRTSREEALLRAQFGGAYADYSALVERFIPGLF